MIQSLLVNDSPSSIAGGPAYGGEAGVYLGTFDKYLLLSDMVLITGPHMNRYDLAKYGEEIYGDELVTRYLRIVCGPPALSALVLGNTHTVAVSKGKVWDLHVSSDGIRQTPGKGMLGLLLQVVMDVGPEKLPGYYGSFREIDTLIDWRLR